MVKGAEPLNSAWGPVGEVQGLAATSTPPGPSVPSPDDETPFVPSTITVPLAFALWSGTEVVGDARSAYAGLAYAFGGDLSDPGWQLRLGGGQGRYASDDTIWVADPRPGRDPTGYDVARSGVVSFADLMLGHQFREGDWTVKLLAGGAWEDRVLTPDEGANPDDFGTSGGPRQSTPMRWTSPADASSSSATACGTAPTRGRTPSPARRRRFSATAPATATPRATCCAPCCAATGSHPGCATSGSA